MGKSRYFFTLSGVILLIGALAVGGRGLNLGIDFTSGTQISVGLQRPATVGQVRSALAGRRRGQRDRAARVRATTSVPNGFQIASKYLNAPQYTQGPRPARQAFRDPDQRQRQPGLQQHQRRADVRLDRHPQRGDRDHRLADRDLALRGAPIRLEVRGARADRAGARPADNQRRLRADGKGGEHRYRRGASDHLGLLALRHDHRVRPSAREHPANAESCVLADRQPLHVRGADPVPGDDHVHAFADHRAAAVRRHDAEGLRVRAADRRRLGRVLVDLHRLAGADALEGARARLPSAPRAHHRRPRVCAGVRGRWRRRPGGDQGPPDRQADRAAGRRGVGRRVRADEAGARLGRGAPAFSRADGDGDATLVEDLVVEDFGGCARRSRRPRQRPRCRRRPRPRSRQAPASDPAGRESGNGADVERAPDVAENEGVAPVDTPRGTGASKSRRTRRHGRRQ